MKKLISLIITAAFFSCNNEGYQKAEDAQDAGREFIRASLDGNYRKAQYYLYRDSTGSNFMIFDKWKKSYDKLDQEEKISFKEANIRAIRIEPVNDSTVNYIYTNSYKPKDTTTIKVIRVNNEWLVDLKDIH